MSSEIFSCFFSTLTFFELHPDLGHDFGFSSTTLSGLGVSLVAPHVAFWGSPRLGLPNDFHFLYDSLRRRHVGVLVSSQTRLEGFYPLEQGVDERLQLWVIVHAPSDPIRDLCLIFLFLHRGLSPSSPCSVQPPVLLYRTFEKFFGSKIARRNQVKGSFIDTK